ncbi:carboxylate clamp-TPR protein [Trifolium repens]|nr:carboxylate clamp-TPR protein [Trifolium repens]
MESSVRRRGSGEWEGKKKKKKKVVVLEDVSDDDDLSKTKSLTDDDLDDLKGCFDLGFGFSYDEIPELCNTLPALELCCCYSSDWKISSRGDNPEDVKARLKYWAQAVACTVKLCT